MTWEGLLIPILSAAGGWALRHFEVLMYPSGTPQSRPAAGGTVSPPPVSATLSDEIKSLIVAEVEKGLTALATRPAPALPTASSPQSTA